MCALFVDDLCVDDFGVIRTSSRSHDCQPCIVLTTTPNCLPLSILFDVSSLPPSSSTADPEEKLKLSEKSLRSGTFLARLEMWKGCQGGVVAIRGQQRSATRPWIQSPRKPRVRGRRKDGRLAGLTADEPVCYEKPGRLY